MGSRKNSDDKLIDWIRQEKENRVIARDRLAGCPAPIRAIKLVPGRLKQWFINVEFKPKIINFIKWVFIDKWRNRRGKPFAQNYYGLTLFCGPQGCGKTASMTWYLERLRKEYPSAWIVTNYDYKYQTQGLKTWDDLLTLENGKDGIVFAIDEIQNEWSSSDFKDFPYSLLGVVTQQRKNSIKIIGTSQVFKRVVVQLREQTNEIVECKTFLGRWTFMRAFNGEDYNIMIESISDDRKMNVSRKWRGSFVQTDRFRGLYDSYAVVIRMRENIGKQVNKVMKIS